MEDKITSRLGLLGILVLIAMLAVSSVSAAPAANASYFVPGDTTASGCGDIKNIELWINTSVNADNGKIVFNYDSNCANVISATLDSSNWASGDVNTGTPGQVIATFGTTSAHSGDQKICDMTVNCTNCSCNCGTWLAFDTDPGTSYIFSGGPIPNINWVDGTYLCGDAIEITKTIWDGSNWVNAIGPLDSSWMGQDVRFNITVTAGCLDLSGLVVEDEMDSSLLYNNNADPTQTSSTAHTATWNIGSLSASTSTSIEFNATIDGYATSVNTATATAGVTDLGGVEVSAMDQASVTTMPPAGIDVTKTVWDGTAWVDEITGATIGDTYRFRCEMDNSGSPGMDLTNIDVWDVISPGLEYADSAMLMTPNGVWRSIEPPTSITYPVEGTNVSWTIDNFLQDPLILQPGQTFVVEYNATVVNYGYNCNVQYASGYCEAALSDVEGSDTACINTPEPDLTVTDITVNYDASGVKNLAIGPLLPGTKTQNNKISADITEVNGIDVIFPFNVRFEIDGIPVHNVSVTSLEAGATTTVYCDDKFLPIAEDTYTINVTTDSSSDIPETAEGNNSMLETLTAIVNGYTGDGWQDGRGISALPYCEQGTINLTYSVGDSKYLSGYSANWTQYTANWTTSDLSIPAQDSCIKKARLYVYYSSDVTPGKNLSDYFTLTFNGYGITRENVFLDEKGYGSFDWATPAGMAVYDVTNVFNVVNNNTAVIDNSYPGPGYWSSSSSTYKYNTGGSMAGMVLAVVYNNTETELERIIWINEGYDTLYAKDYYAVSSEEATTYAEFEGCEPIPMPEVVGAKLVTVAPFANDGDDMNRLYFNDGEWHGVWNGYVGATNLGIAETDVRTHLKATDNTATFQSHIPDGATKGDFMAASNAFLIVETAEGQIEVVAPDECIGVTEQFDVLINVTSVVPVYGVEYELNFNSSVIHAEWQNEGDFLKQDGATTNVYINTIDNSVGKVTFAVTRTNTETGVTEPGTLATVHFTAVKMGASTDLTLTSVKVSDPDAEPISLEKFADTVQVCNNVPPVAAAECLFKYNNVGTKYMSKTYFDGSESTDDGSITNYRWYFGDGNYGAGMTYDHIYGSWNWNGASYSYDPFEVILTVEDDGTPMMDNTFTIPVDVYIAGDANGDGEVDIFDATIVGLEWDHEADFNGDIYWWNNERGDKADLNNDQIVDIFDAVIIGANWDHTAW